MLKPLILRATPNWMLHQAKKWYYPRLLRKHSVADLAVLRALITPGDHVLDLGANAGWYTKVLSELVGPTGSVTSVEPIPPTFELLTCCVRALHLGNVNAHCCAVSDRDGIAVMRVPSYQAGGDNFYEARLVATGTAHEGLTFAVELRTIDSISACLPSVSFLKADVEGHEWPVIRGGASLIRRDRPVLLVEVTTDPDNTSSDGFALKHWLAEAGYGAYRFDGERLRCQRPGEGSGNHYFLPDHHAARLRAAGIALL